MARICTTIEQSKKLLELGIDVNTADMHYQWYSETESALHVGKGSKKLNADCPAWSLSALMSLLPSGWELINSERGDEYKLQTPDLMSKVWYDTLFEAVFNMIYWLLENKKL